VHFYVFAAKIICNMLIEHPHKGLAARCSGKDAIRFPISEEIAWVGNTREEMLDLNRDLRFIAGG
jgi:hypothetical protein